MLTKKSQSGMEFMLTYGWAFIIILLTIGAISYFSFDLEKTAPEQFILGDTNIEHFALYESTEGPISFGGSPYSGVFGRIEFDFQNPEADSIEILDDFLFVNNNNNLLYTCENVPQTIAVGQTFKARCDLCKNISGNTCEDFLIDTTKNKIGVTIKYKISDQAFTKVKQGEILATANQFNLPSGPTDYCNDGSDNDNDGLIDLGADYSCDCGSQDSEENACDYNQACYMLNGKDCVSGLLCDDYWGGSFLPNAGACKFDNSGKPCSDNNNCARSQDVSCIGGYCLKVIDFMSRSCDPDDDVDCKEPYVCDSTQFCKVALGDHCEADEDCEEGVVCNPTTHVCGFDTPVWCRVVSMPDTFYWDDNEQQCWVNSRTTGENCDDACDNQGLKCDPGNWNDDTPVPCTILNKFVSCQICWQGTTEKYYPGYDNTGRCYYRGDTPPPYCDSRDPIVTRICVCEKLTP